MTPKEKASELIGRFKNFVPDYVVNSDINNVEYFRQKLLQAKKIATTVVDEILFEIQYHKKVDWINEREGGQEYIVYWLKVRAEIESINLPL